VQGPAGPTGPQGPAGAVGSWASYREFWYDSDQATIRTDDASKVTDIAAYMQQNPSLQVGIDTSTNPNGSDQRNPALATRRGDSVRDALITAGVPASNIKTGNFGDARYRRDGRVEVLVSTAK
jgi:peptidoglycan-associated lipoprotein